jgi:hypothetical protein
VLSFVFVAFVIPVSTVFARQCPPLLLLLLFAYDILERDNETLYAWRAVRRGKRTWRGDADGRAFGRDRDMVAAVVCSDGERCFYLDVVEKVAGVRE